MHTKSYLGVLEVALFMIGKKSKQHGYPSTDEWINKMWSVYTMGYYSAIERNVSWYTNGWTLKIINERKQTQMAKNYTVSLNMKYLELANPQKQKVD